MPVAPGEAPFQWSEDGSSIYVFRFEELPARIFAVNITTGQRKLIREIITINATGITSIANIRFLPDGKHYAYEFGLNLGTLYLMKGPR
jgi:hypothetical protein